MMLQSHTRRYTCTVVSGTKILLIRRHLLINVQAIWCQHSKRLNLVALLMSAIIRARDDHQMNIYFLQEELQQEELQQDLAASCRIILCGLLSRKPNYRTSSK